MTQLWIGAAEYMMHGPYFWASMGMTAAIAMFIGALLYDGNLAQVSKSLVSVGSYIIMLLWVTISRVVQTYYESLGFLYTTKPHYALAGTLTIMAVSASWLFGVFLGVLILSIRSKGRVK